MTELTVLQRDILQFAKRSDFHGKLRDYIRENNVQEEDAINAVKELKKHRIVSMPPDILNSWIGVTNYGWKVMGW